MTKLSNKIFALLICLCITFGFGGLFLCVQPTAKFSAQADAVASQSITDLPGTNTDGLIVSKDKSANLATVGYVMKDNVGYDTSKASSYGFVFSKADGTSAPFANFFIQTYGEGGEVLQSQAKINGYDSYGYIAGSGEDVLAYNSQGELKKDENGNPIVAGHRKVGIALKYNYSFNDNKTLSNASSKYWSISDDGWEGSIDGMSSVGCVGYGAVIVQKFVPTEDKSLPTSKADWKRVNSYAKDNAMAEGLHTVDFFNQFNPNNHTTPFTVYTPLGEDLQKGVYIKITVAYEIRHYEGWKWFKGKTYSYKNVVEQTTFYLCNSSGEIIFQNLYFQATNADDEEQTQQPDEATDTERKTGAISNNQGSVDGFRLDTMGENYEISYTQNGSTNSKIAKDGDVFYTPGRYDFKIKTKLGMVRNKTVYIHESGKERNKEIYFGGNLVDEDSQRVFDPNSIYPVYVKGQTKIRTLDENKNSSILHAPLVGKVFKVEGEWDEHQQKYSASVLPNGTLIAQKTATDKNWSFSNFESGKYVAIFANNEEYFLGTATGDNFVFVSKFEVRDTGFAPSANLETLQTMVATRDFASLHYVAKIPTAGKGKLLVVFLNENAAFEFACKHLVSTVTKFENGFVFDGKTYTSEIAMLSVLHQKAKNMVEKRYFDANNPDTFLTLKTSIILPTDNAEDEEASKTAKAEDVEEFVNITNRNFEKDVLIFADADATLDMTAGEMFLNSQKLAYLEEEDGVFKKVSEETRDLYFLKVAEFESAGQGVCVEKEDGSMKYSVPFGVSIQEFLEMKSAPTGKYNITEINAFGTTTFSAVYIRKGDVTTSLELTVLLDGTSATKTFNQMDNNTTICANSIIFEEAFNQLDPYGIIKLKKANGQEIICQLDEVENLPMLNEVGLHEIVLQDRLGNTSNLFVRITNASKICNLTLSNNGEILSQEKVYAGKIINLPQLSSDDENLKFLGWADEQGNIKPAGEFVFDGTSDTTFTAAWSFEKVEISILDGTEIAHYTKSVDDSQVLPQLSKEGYSLYGFRFTQADGTYRFYRGQIANVPNVASMTLEAVWKSNDNITNIQQGTEAEVKITLVDKDVVSVLSCPKTGKISLPQLQSKDGLLFEGWLYESSKLSGKIFTDEIDLLDVISEENQTAIKLSAIWLKSATVADDAVVGGKSNLVIADGGFASTTSKLLIYLALLVTFGGLLFVFLKRFIKNNKFSYCVEAFSAPEGAYKTQLHLSGNLGAADNLETYVRQKYAQPQKIKGAKAVKLSAKKGFYDRVIVPIIIAVLCFCMLTLSQGILLMASKGLAEEQAFTKTISRVIDRQNEKQQLLQLQAQQEDASWQVRSSEYALAEEYVDELGFNNKQSFLNSLVMVDLLEMGYEDVFDATATISGENKVIKGIGFTHYATGFEVGEEKYFGAGFIAYNGQYMLQEEDLKKDIFVERLEENQEDFEYNKFLLKLDEKWGVNHYVAYEEYVTYYVANHALICTRMPDSPTCYVDAYGKVYNYDTGSVCHYPNYGQEHKFDAYSITSNVSFQQTLETLQGYLANQDQNGMEVFVEKADFISAAAINSYMSHNQDEKFLGVDADTLLWYEANIEKTQYFLITEDGQVEVLDLPSTRASLFERIMIAIAAAAVVFAGIVLCAVAPGLGDIAGGAMISAAIDIFTQVTISGKAVTNVDWKSVGVSALTGAITGGFGAYFNSAAKIASVGKTVFQKFLIKAGAQALSAFYGGTCSYMITCAANGETPSLRDCMKSVGLGMATSILMYGGGELLGKFSEKIAGKLAWFRAVGDIVAGTITSFVSYAISCAISGQPMSIEGALLSLGMGAFMSGMAVLGNAAITSAKNHRAAKIEENATKSRIKHTLPSDKNENWSYEGADGKKITKADLLKNPKQEAYLVSKDGTQKYKIENGYRGKTNLLAKGPTVGPSPEELARMQNRIKYHLPSDKNKNYEIVGRNPDGSSRKLTKADLLQDPTQEAYVLIKNGKNAGQLMPIKNGYIDRKVMSEGSVFIKGGIVAGNRKKTFDYADEQMAKQWNEHPDTIPDDVKAYFRDKGIKIDYNDPSRNRLRYHNVAEVRRGVKSGGLGYTWDELEDMHTCLFVKTKDHNALAHAGGQDAIKFLVGECNGDFTKLRQDLFNTKNYLLNGGK